MTDFNSQLIKTAAGLLRYTPSTDRADYPRVPGYYRRAVDKYHDKARRAAILLRKASDRLRDLNAKIKQLEQELEDDYLIGIAPPDPRLEDEDVPF